MLFQFLVVLCIATLIANVCNADDPEKSSCKKLNEKEVRGLFAAWNDALQTRDSNKVADKYWDESVLLPTLSNIPRPNRETKIEYFNDFLKKKPYGTVSKDFIYVDICNQAQYSGLYDFKLITPEGDEVVAPARFTYVFTTDKKGKEWKIKTHHSSGLPNPVGGKMFTMSSSSSSSSSSLRGDVSSNFNVEDWLNLDLEIKV